MPLETTSGQPGFELEEMLKQLGVEPGRRSFRRLIRQMNWLDSAGCRQRAAWIISELRTSAARWGMSKVFGDTTTPAWIRLRSKLLFRIDPMDPIPGLVEEAIQRSGGDIAVDRGAPLIQNLGEGVGTELMKLFKSLGVHPTSSCSCRKLARQMNELGVQGCRVRVDWITSKIKDNYRRWGWGETFLNTTTAAWNLLRTGLVFKLDTSDPITGLVNEALLRAESVEKCRASI